MTPNMSDSTLKAISIASADDGEELARAELYGLLASLWLAAPDAALLAQFKVAVTAAPQPGGHLEAPWGALVAAMRASSVAAARAEFDALFGGVGRPELMVYGSFHLSGFLNERPLALLRADLAALGLGRGDQVQETEDHIACEFEVMRYLIAGDDVAVCNLEQQRRFFRSHLQPWVERLCDATLTHPRAALWRAVAGLTAAFMQVETQGFDLLEA
jgi:TorA maturation chaperone TorD